MSAWEYKVVPAPTKGVKERGIKGADSRFAHALEILMNDMGAEGWEFQRAETLPSIERSGLTGTTTEWRNMMVFRRARSDETNNFEHELLPPPDPTFDLEPDPTVTAATLQVRDVQEPAQVAMQAIDETDEFQHIKGGENQKSPGRQGRGRKKRNQAGKNKKAQVSAQDMSTNEAETLLTNEPASIVTPEDENTATKSAFAQRIDEISKD